MKNNNLYKIICLLFILLIFDNTCAQEKLTFNESIIGKWEGQGALMGNEASFSMNWKNTLGDKFLKLTFQNQFADKSGVKRIMKANGYYNLKTMKGYWFDSRGYMLPLSLEVTEASMTVFWGDETSEKGKTIYTLVGKDINVKDFIFRNDKYLSFGNASYTKYKL